MTPSPTDLDGEREAPTSAAIARATDSVPPSGITNASEVDDALAADVGQSFARWGRIQLVGMGALVAAFLATMLLPAPAMLVAAVGFVPAVLIGNVLVDRATVNEFVQLGLSRELARRLLGKTYAVPEMYAALPATLSSSPSAKRKVTAAIKKALARC